MPLIVHYRDGYHAWEAIMRPPDGTMVSDLRSTAWDALESWVTSNPPIALDQTLAMLDLPSLGRVLEPFHDGQSIYAVMSCALVDMPSDPESITRAIWSLRYVRKLIAFPELLSEYEEQIHRLLGDELARRFGHLLTHPEQIEKE
jgi:hypothetical protein